MRRDVICMCEVSACFSRYIVCESFHVCESLSLHCMCLPTFYVSSLPVFLSLSLSRSLSLCLCVRVCSPLPPATRASSHVSLSRMLVLVQGVEGLGVAFVAAVLVVRVSVSVKARGRGVAAAVAALVLPVFRGRRGGRGFLARRCHAVELQH
mgnify:CR=1 FL=1